MVREGQLRRWMPVDELDSTDQDLFMVMSRRPDEGQAVVATWDILVGNSVLTVTEPYLSISSEEVEGSG